MDSTRTEDLRRKLQNPNIQLTNCNSSQESRSNEHHTANYLPTDLAARTVIEHILIQPTLFEQRVPRTKDWVIAKVEAIIESIVDAILEDKKKLVITLRSRGRVTDQGFDHESRSIRPAARRQTRQISFPGRTPREARKFAVLVRILQLVHEALISDIITTKRDIYYKDPALFLKQAVVDRYVDDIACTFGVERDCLNVVAAAKGLVAGALSIRRKDGSILSYALENEGALVPSVKDIDSIDLVGVRWILLIEKEATFRSLSANRFWDNPRLGKGILLTAKGYPDISTRAFLRSLSKTHPTTPPQDPIPIYALVDFDPHGLGILSTYKYGSIALAHENAQLTVSRIRWLGVKSTDLQEGEAGEAQGLLSLSARDRGKALKMLGSEVFAEETEWRREMQVMLFLNIKAEVQVMSEFGRMGLERWIEGKVLGNP
ncbi:MAG: hypothetical protein M1813_003722 [Trichoglossum hirsutum]|nr:MAG: hypothetical protein M1813_003722 [Trichoglossum hirsutum]